LTLPNGATDTSASGVFLAQQGSDTPEPSTWALCGLGLMLAGISRVRARGRATSAWAWGRLADR
jgi:hypothetical protein